MGDMRTFHVIGFSLLFSAGVCYLSGQYKFTVDAKTKQGLSTCKAVVTFQFVMNWLTRVFIWLPACYYTLKNFHTVKDTISLWWMCRYAGHDTLQSCHRRRRDHGSDEMVGKGVQRRRKEDVLISK